MARDGTGERFRTNHARCLFPGVQGRRKVIKSGGAKLDQMGGGQIESKAGGRGNWPNVIFLFLVQGEKRGHFDTPPSHGPPPVVFPPSHVGV